MTWSAVVVNHNAGGHLARALESIAGCDAPPDELVVVDNASDDGSIAAAEARRDTRVVASPRNLGYARAANLGIATTRTSVVAVLNPDLVLRPDGIARLLERFTDEPDLAAIGPRVEEPDGRVYPSARQVPRLGDAVRHAALGTFFPNNPSTRRYRELDADPGVARDVDWVSGAAMWLRRSALDGVGGWDERYFMYVEDVDLCDRLRRGGGRIVYEPAACVVHTQGVSASRHPYRMIAEHHRSLARYAGDRWHGPRRALLVPAAVGLSARAGVMMGLHALRRGRDGTAPGAH